MTGIPQEECSKIFCARVKEEIFHSITHHNQIWQPDPYDVEDIHQESRDCFARLLNRISNAEQTDSGRIMLLLGDSGAGKTHLMRAFRNQTHEKGLGYFAYMQMTSSVSNYASYALHYTIDSLDKPYCAISGNMTGLVRLSNALIERRQVVSQNDIDQLRNGELSRDELNDLIHKIADDILNKQGEQFRSVDLDLIRAFLYLQHDEPATHARIRKYLRCENMSEYDCKMLGNITPRIQEDDPDRLLQALAQLMRAINTGAFVICLDQLEDIHQAEGAGIKFRRAMEKIIKLAEIPNVLVVVACLNDIYSLLKSALPESQKDRIEKDPDPIILRGKRSEAEIRKLIGIRLQDLYDSQGVDSNLDDSIFPFGGEIPASQVGKSTRQILDWCRQQREQSILTGVLPPHPGPVPDPDPDPDSDSSFDQLWNDYLVDSHPVPESENEMLQLLGRMLGHCATEFGHSLECNIVQREDFLDLDIRNTAENTVIASTIGLCQKSSRGGALAKQIDKLQTMAGKRTAIAIRSVEFPADPKTRIALRLGEFVANGGKKVLVSDADWRTMVAMESFREQHAQQPDFTHWLKDKRPLHSLPSFQKILDLTDIPIPDPDPDPNPNPNPNPSRLRIGVTQGYQLSPYEVDISQFVRHAAFLGGSGSGKTTLALNIIEQLLLQGIPAILLDRKGDLCSYAKEEAWRTPVLDPARTQMRKALRDKIEVNVYTPGAIEGQGRPLNIPIVPKGLENLSSGECEQLANHAAFSLGRIMGYKDQGLDKTRIVILGKAISILSQLNKGHALTINNLLDFIDKDDPLLLNAIGKLDPKLSKKLVQDLQTLELGHKNLFSQSGELLNTENLFDRSSDKTRLTIISTSSLGSNDNILFWVSQLLVDIGRFAAKSPSEKLQGVILFDEADLYLPAQSKPATKEPLENLLRRARSAGIGLMLATQSPGDLDYRCRDQISTWFIGRIKEKTALDKLKPMLSEAKTDVSSKLAGQTTGEFYAIHNGEVSNIKANRSLVQAEQVPAHEILKLAGKKKENPISSFIHNIFATL
ncbi:MAG TPA: DUF2791 family P-loop domain-containing protein [Nitrosomonas mobilis]|nr:DUF2791 family P-loop domain-containing protein [Nitrosomonas mobilis]